MKELAGRVALVTGASRGLGRHIARTLAGQGMDLVLAARAVEPLETLRAEIAALGVQAMVVPTDVTDPAQLDGLVARALAELGGVDLLVNNAGIEQIAAFDQVSVAAIDRVIDVNLRAPMRLTRLLLPSMIERGRGHIVNMASLAGHGAAAFNEPYGATKHAMVGFTQAFRASAQAAGWG